MTDAPVKWTWERMLEKTEEEWHGDTEQEMGEAPEEDAWLDGGEGERTGGEGEAEGSAEAAQWGKGGSVEDEEQGKAEEQDTDGEVIEYRSWFWYLGRLCLNVHFMAGWWMSLGVHISLRPAYVDVHVGWFIVSVMGEERGREIEGYDRYYLEGIEPE